MRHVTRWMGFLVGITALSTLGCGGILGSCTYVSAGTVVSCVEYEQYPFGKDMAKMACTSGAVFSDSPCTQQNRVARCRVETNPPAFALNLSTRVVYNYYPPTTLDLARVTCEAYDDDTGFTEATFLIR